MPVLDSAGPSGRNSTNTRPARLRTRRSGPRAHQTCGPLIERPTALARMPGPFCILEGAPGQEIELTEEQQGGTMEPTEATAEATSSAPTGGTIAVADEPATSPSPETEATAADTAAND